MERGNKPVGNEKNGAQKEERGSNGEGKTGPEKNSRRVRRQENHQHFLNLTTVGENKKRTSYKRTGKKKRGSPVVDRPVARTKETVRLKDNEFVK